MAYLACAYLTLWAAVCFLLVRRPDGTEDIDVLVFGLCALGAALGIVVLV